ncbi:hypothetical protein BOH73_10705 [Pseudomonas versuta]|uniref:Uncharacterized protein n=1 Tax=Pseudomonas versuta TaxID=1788301 RepID=A0ABX3EAA6_9PSED|nr:hypothetical protein AOC04_11565 [Pseudomonas versuta]OKA21751.1 hypothetical protein BOH73_10705 [Pseudomonas versuta]
MPSKKIIDSHSTDLGTLLDQLEGLPRDTQVYFGGLDFYRVKRQGPNQVQIEFNQSVHRTNEDVLVVVDPE